MIYCVKCGTQLPDDAKFCAKCGTPIAAVGAGPAASSSPAASAAPTIAAAGVSELKCPSCGAPIKPTFGDMVVTCDYCGSSVTLGGAGWKSIQKHTMLALKVTDPNAALATVRASMDQGLFHRHEFEQSKVVDTKLSYVPFWVVPVSASTTYQYQAAAASVGATLGTIAAGEMLGGALGGRRGGMTIIPIVGGPVVNPTRSETMSGKYEFPVIAVKALASYQPRDYQFQLAERSLFDKKAIPGTAAIVNGDVGEDSAQGSAKAFVEQLQSELAHKKHSMVSKLETKTEIAEGELLHVPIWTFQVEHKGQRQPFVVDGNASRVIRTVG